MKVAKRKDGRSPRRPPVLSFRSVTGSGAGVSEVGEEEADVRAVDAAHAVEVGRGIDHAPLGEQEAEVLAVDDAVTVEVADQFVGVALDGFDLERVDRGIRVTGCALLL